jgi:hypothetical protein
LNSACATLPEKRMRWGADTQALVHSAKSKSRGPRSASLSHDSSGHGVSLCYLIRASANRSPFVYMRQLAYDLVSLSLQRHENCTPVLMKKAKNCWYLTHLMLAMKTDRDNVSLILQATASLFTSEDIPGRRRKRCSLHSRILVSETLNTLFLF